MASPWDDARIEVRPSGFRPPVDLPFEKKVRRRGAWLEFQALRATQPALGVLPEALLRPTLGGLARFARLVDRRHAESARDFVRTAFPEASDREVEARVLAAYRHLARVAVESERLPGVIGTRLADHYEVEACDGLEELVAAREGVIVLTAHVGFWEGVGLPFHALGYPHGVAVGKPPNNMYLARWIQRRREEQGAVLLPREGAIQGVTAAVRSGGAAILLLDQRPRQRPITVPFFGRPAACDRSAGVLVRRVGAPLLVVGCYLTDVPGRYRLVFQRVVRPAEVEGASSEEVMALVNRETEALVRRAPEQYFWLHDRYRGMPARGEGVADSGRATD